MPWSTIGWAIIWHLGAVILLVSVSHFAGGKETGPGQKETDL
jgi:hypothetical protein